MFTARNRFLSAFNIARRHITIADDALVAHMSVRHGNAVYIGRKLDCNVRTVHSMTQPTDITSKWMTSKDESRELMAVWPDVVHDITNAIENLNIPDVSKWMTEILQYNNLGGKKIRSFILFNTYKLLAKSDQLTEENIRLLRILAWCIELMMTYILMIDDVLDRSLIRRGQPCWYRYNDIGVMAANDSLMLESAMYYLIRKHFKEKDCYVHLIEIFQDITMKITMGQCLDMLCTNFGKKPNLDLFTMKQYNSIVEYKTSDSLFISVQLAMQFAGIKDPEMYRQAKTILLEMGHLFQVQDDYLACFGDSEVSGKIGTDIEEGKCTWLIVKALQRASPKQRKILEECYGFSDPEKLKRVKQLFIDLDLPNAYSTYEEETYNLLNVHIQQLSSELPHSIFLNLLEKLYHRVL